MADFLYCLNSSTIRPVPILKKIELAGKAGYPAIELLGIVDDINTIENALEDIAKAGPPVGTVVLDPLLLFRGGDAPEGTTKLRGTQIATMHFNDAPATPPREKQHHKDRV